MHFSKFICQTYDVTNLLLREISRTHVYIIGDIYEYNFMHDVYLQYGHIYIVLYHEHISTVA